MRASEALSPDFDSYSLSEAELGSLIATLCSQLEQPLSPQEAAEAHGALVRVHLAQMDEERAEEQLDLLLARAHGADRELAIAAP